MFRLFVNSLNCVSKPVCWLIVAIFISGCISAGTGQRQSSEDKLIPEKDLPEKPLIESIDVNKEGKSINVLISGNDKLTYTAIKENFPLGIHVYFPDAGISDDFVAPSVSQETGISSIDCFYSDDTEKTAQVKIVLTENFHYQAESENDAGVRLTFFPTDSIMQGKSPDENGEPLPPAEDDLFKAGETQAIYNRPSDAAANNIDMAEATGAFASPEPAKLSDIDLTTNENGASSIVITTTRPVKHEILKNPDDPFELDLTLFHTNISDHPMQQMEASSLSAVNRIIPMENKWKNQTDIKVNLRERVPYRLVQEENHLILNFEPSSIDLSSVNNSTFKKPETLPASEIITAMNTDGKTEPQAPGNDNETYADESFESRDQAQESSMGTIEALDTIQQTEPIVETLPGDDTFNMADDSMAMPQEDTWKEPEPIYTGEKISLDFFETDIKNVFRILRTVSGDNFAIDKDVTGNVTLTLDKPVPWDQVLDLILKMNGLGKVREGNIIRIATLETLKREDAQHQERLAAMERARQQEKKLEPLVTEYIPINYSSAQSDIRPHLEKLITPERGQLSIDSRTNTIIITDVRENIEKAKDLIYRLDKVTPQIMISARIVEVNKSFSRELGVNWGMSSQDVYREDLGGTYGFDIALNTPVDATSSGIGYTFSRLTGTPFILDARLNASELSGDSKTISSPKILTLDNKVAKIEQGLDYGYQSGVDENGNPVIAFKQINLSLEVTPHVTPDKRVNMILKISKNEISGFTANVPSLSTNDAQTELLVNDGNTIVIGGIVKSVTNESTTGFPFLSTIPFIGRAFRSDTNNEDKNELLIFITPKIVQLEQVRNKEG